MTKPRTPTRAAFVAVANYREQPDLRCCGTCRHAFAGSHSYCTRTVPQWVVTETAVCDAYERQETM